jgi:hypothetical protein
MKNTFIKSYIALSFVYLLIILLGHEPVMLNLFLIPTNLGNSFINFHSKTLLLTALTLSWFGISSIR